MTRIEAKERALICATMLLETSGVLPDYLPLSDADAERFQTTWGAPLPDDLREWLRNWNGGAGPDELDPARFFGFGQPRAETPAYEIERHNGYRGQDWPIDHFPFAGDGCGNSYLLVPAPTGAGWWTAFWDREVDYPKGSAGFDYYMSSSLWHFLLGGFEIGPNGSQGQTIDEYPWVEFPDGPGWPFSKPIAEDFDPEFAAYDGPLAPWNID